MSRLMPTRFPTKCGVCRTAIPEGTQAYYNKLAAKGHRMTCVACHERGATPPSPTPAPAAPAPTITMDSRNVSMTWESAGDFFSYVGNTPRVWRKQYSQRTDGDYSRFCKTSSFEQAFRMTQAGWPEGAARMNRELAAAPVAVSVRMPTQVYDVAGAYPLVPAAVAGDPMCMVAPGEESTRRKPVLRWVVSMSALANVEPSQIINRGVAILGALDAYESAGYSVQVDIQRATKEDNGQWFIAHLPLKRAGEMLDMDRAAFMLAHPSFLRRIVFAAMETIPSLEKSFTASYGYSQNAPAPDADLFLPAMCDGEEDKWNTPAKAAVTMAAYLESAASQLAAA
jgi:hypothetical protein